MPSQVAALGDFDVFAVITNGLHPNGAVDVNDLIAFLALFEAGDLRGDLVGAYGPFPDAATDINDLIHFFQLYELGTRSTTTDHRFAWRGYQWDPYLNLYHVRNRVFDSGLVSWLQPDPLGDIDGPNVYAYVGWDPFNRIDPYGLEGDGASCGCGSPGGGGGGNGASSGGSSGDAFDQLGLGNLDENSRAGSGPLNDQSAELRRQTKIAGEAYLDAVTAPLIPENYVRLAYEVTTHPLQMLANIGQTASDIWNFNSLSSDRQAELFGGGAGRVFGSPQAASRARLAQRLLAGHSFLRLRLAQMEGRTFSWANLVPLCEPDNLGIC